MHWEVPGSHVPPQCCLQTRVTEPSSVSGLQDRTAAQWAAVMSGPASNVSAGEEGTPKPVPVQACRMKSSEGKGCLAGHGEVSSALGVGTCPLGGAGMDPTRILSAASALLCAQPCEAPSPPRVPRLCPHPVLSSPTRVTDRGGS